MDAHEHHNLRLSYEHSDPYEGSYRFDPASLDIEAIWDDDLANLRCNGVDCDGLDGLRSAVAVLASILAEGPGPRTIGEAWRLLRSSSNLDNWFDPLHSEVIVRNGHQRLAVCLSGCEEHTIFVVDLPDGWSVVTDLDQIDWGDEEEGQKVLPGALAELDPDFSVIVDPAMGDMDPPRHAKGTAPRQGVLTSGDRTSADGALEALELVLLAGEANSRFLREGVDPDEYLVVSRRQLTSLRQFLAGSGII